MRRILNNISNHSNWFSYYIFKYTSSKKKEFTFKCRSGLKIIVPQRLLQTYKECFFDETYFKGLPKSIVGKQIKTVVDIGANVGYFSLFMLANFPKAKVIAFEPMPVNFKLLSKYMQENSTLDFAVINKAVSSKGQGSITLNYDSTDSFTTDASIFDASSRADSIEVKTTCLQDIIYDNKLDNIDFLKLDCEGSEYAILYDAPTSILNKISIMSIETHSGKEENENAVSLINYLKNNAFKINFKNDIIWAWKNSYR
ncbi:MAG: FkbM family methyltransferase [Bacteroidetes bacterium]|nr:FkbM family methyltransferase [Bacteroidota bacterium]MBL6943285.1 FkbM family methyltransferase [Bacteroidales bacterium]